MYTLILSNDLAGNNNNYLLDSLLKKNNIDGTIIADKETYESDEKIKSDGFYNLTRSPYIKKPSAWDKALYYISKNKLLDSYSHFFFIEDDVYSLEYRFIISFIVEAKNYNVDFITKQMRSNNHYSGWRYWKEDYVKLLKSPHQSFNPICCLSSKLVRFVLDYKDEYGSFNFHEILFASLCKEYNLTYIEYINTPNLSKYIGKVVYKPISIKEDILDEKIYHPVKKNKNARKIKAPS